MPGELHIEGELQQRYWAGVVGTRHGRVRPVGGNTRVAPNVVMERGVSIAPTLGLRRRRSVHCVGWMRLRFGAHPAASRQQQRGDRLSIVVPRSEPVDLSSNARVVIQRL